MSDNERIGVLVMAYGTPASVDDIEPYYTHIRRGRPAPPELLEELIGRYAAIGGISPLAARTEAQRAAIETALEAIAPGRYQVVLGQKHATPFIEDAVEALAADGITTTVGLVLAPHYSGFSVGQYQGRAAEAGAAHGMTHHAIDSWHLDPAYVDFLTDAVTAADATLPDDRKVLFTAHSLPERVLADDPYPEQLRQSAAAVGERLGLDPGSDWSIAWQSAGRTPRHVARPRHPRRAARTRFHQGHRRCAGVRPGVRGRPPRGAVRPRHRGRRPGRGTGPGVCPHPLAQRRPHRDGGTGGPHPRCRQLTTSPGPGARAQPVGTVVVIGAGITGLAAAHRLHADHPGLNVVVLEASAGRGLSPTEPFDNVALDCAADAFLARVPEAVALCRRTRHRRPTRTSRHRVGAGAG